MNPKEIAEIIKNEITKQVNDLAYKTYYRGEITAVLGNHASVEIEGGSEALTEVLSIGSYAPKIGDRVLVLSIGRSGANHLILGRLSGSEPDLIDEDSFETNAEDRIPSQQSVKTYVDSINSWEFIDEAQSNSTSRISIPIPANTYIALRAEARIATDSNGAVYLITNGSSDVSTNDRAYRGYIEVNSSSAVSGSWTTAGVHLVSLPNLGGSAGILSVELYASTPSGSFRGTGYSANTSGSVSRTYPLVGSYHNPIDSLDMYTAVGIISSGSIRVWGIRAA